MNKPLPTTADLELRPPTRGRAGSASTRRRSATTARSATAPASPIKPLYTPRDWSGDATTTTSAIPGQPPYTRGIYPTMHRGRTWTQRQLIGLGTPPDYNARLRDIIAQGATAVSLIPCNSVYPRLRHGRGARRAARHLRRRRQHASTHMDTLPRRASTSRAMSLRDERSVAVHAARVHAGDGEAPRRSPGARSAARRTRATTSRHYVANHMFFRIALPGRAADPRPTTSSSATGTCRSGIRCRSSASTCSRPARRRPRRWRSRSPPRSRTPTTASRAGMDPGRSSCRASRSSSTSRSRSSRRSRKFRAGRRIWARLARERYGAKDPRLVALQVPRADVRRRPHAAAAAQQRRARHGAGDGRHLRRPAVAAHRRVRRGAVVPDRVRRADRGRHAEHPARGSAPHRRDRPARRQLLRRDADRRDGGARSCARCGWSRTRAACTRAVAVGHRAAADRRIGAALPGEGRSGRADRRRRQRATRSTRTRSARPLAAEARPGGRCARTSKRSARTRRALGGGRRARAGRARRAPPTTRTANVFAQVVAAAEAGCTHGEICGTLRRELGFGHVQAIV